MERNYVEIIIRRGAYDSVLTLTCEGLLEDLVAGIINGADELQEALKPILRQLVAAEKERALVMSALEATVKNVNLPESVREPARVDLAIWQGGAAAQPTE